MADQLSLKDDAPQTYVVKKGDTLWDISAMYLEEPWLWPKLWRWNPEINNPHLIYPGDKLRLTFDDQGQPVLVKDNAQSSGKPEYKWSPQIRKKMKDANPITILPLEELAPLLNYSNVLTKDILADAATVMGADEKYKSHVEGAILYAKGDLQAGKSYAIYKQGEPILDPETGDHLGYYAILAGTAKGLRDGNMANRIPASLMLENSRREIRAGDVILEVNTEQLLPAFYQMRLAEGKDVQAMFIRNHNNVREFGKLEIVLLNKGANANIQQGEIYAINRQSPDVLDTEDGPIYEEDASRWYRLTKGDDSEDRYEMPIENIGQLMVFKVQDKTSFAVVLATKKSVRISDTVTAP
ncbi:LysM peptidoglycan-binding domain-containing protein [Thalassotalea mangrovi]|uniref:LysM peptidoglycan-binding domain-containing protein n=1 Tax=Thalassotalea mangrovi TaxID=2572245 RepID=UPI00145D07A3|nr:LysM domain-containing protein [Thalassotalea mangrovi]